MRRRITTVIPTSRIFWRIWLSNGWAATAGMKKDDPTSNLPQSTSIGTPCVSIGDYLILTEQRLTCVVEDQCDFGL